MLRTGKEGRVVDHGTCRRDISHNDFAGGCWWELVGRGFVLTRLRGSIIESCRVIGLSSSHDSYLLSTHKVTIESPYAGSVQITVSAMLRPRPLDTSSAVSSPEHCRYSPSDLSIGMTRHAGPEHRLGAILRVSDHPWWVALPDGEGVCVHFFNPAVQLITTCNGSSEVSSTGVRMRNSLPSAVTS